MYEKYKPKEVIHLAALVGGIKFNIENPADIIYQNIMINTLVINYAYKYNVKKLIGVLSNCAYPDIAKKYPLKESELHNGPPQLTNFAYAISKRTLDIQVKSYNKQYGCNYFCVIPCNMYGPHDNFNLDQGHFVASLIRKIHEIKLNKQQKLKLLGTGKPLRQYLFSEDFAKILLKLLKNYKRKEPINIAPKKQNYTIKKIAEIAIENIGSKYIEIEFDNKFPDGQYRKDLSIEKLQKIIGDFKFTPLSAGIKKTYKWYLKDKNIYN